MTDPIQRRCFVVLLPTLECNLDCSYCFQPHPAGRWDEAQTTHVLHEVFELARLASFAALRLHWQGGEPLLLGTRYWSHALPLARTLAARAGVELDQRLQTNLTLLEPPLLPLVHEFLSGSLGTSFEPHPGRRFPGETGEDFRRRWREKRDLAEAAGVEVGVLSLLDSAAIQRPAGEYLARLRDEYGVRGVRLTLPFASPTGRGLWLDPARAGAFLADAYRWWERHGGDNYLHVRPFAFLQDRITTGRSTRQGLCFFHRNCADIALAVAPSGDVTLCDDFVEDPAAVLGNVFRQPLSAIFHGPARARLQDRVRNLADDDCFACRWLSLCWGGCLARSRLSPGSTAPRFHYCETYRTLFAAIARPPSPSPSSCSCS